jgi:hypothetical protein
MHRKALAVASVGHLDFPLAPRSKDVGQEAWKWVEKNPRSYRSYVFVFPPNAILRGYFNNQYTL